MPPKKSSASPTASAVQHKPPDGISTQLWELSKSTASLVKKLSAQETEEDHHQGCSKAEVARLLWQETAQKTGAGQQRRKEALDNGGLETALQGIQCSDAAVVEPCAGLLNTFLHEAPDSLEMLLTAPSNGVLALWSVIAAGGYPAAAGTSQHAGCLEILLQAEHTNLRVMKLLEGADWDALAQALKHHLVHSDADNHKDNPMIVPSSPRDTLSAVLQLMAAILCPVITQQAASLGASVSGQAQKLPSRTAQPAAKPAGHGKPQLSSGSTDSSRQVLLEKAAQSDTPTVLLQICQDTEFELKSRETAVKLVHALLMGPHWPMHHVCLAGTGSAALVAVLAAGDMSQTSRIFAAATLKNFLLPTDPMPASTVAQPMIVRKAAPSKAQQAKAQDRQQASLKSSHALILPETALHQAMDRISAVISTGAVPILTALATGVPESKAAKPSSDAAALQLEAISCLRLLSLSDPCKILIAKTGQAIKLLPLLTSKINTLRWMSRQVLLNVAAVEEAAEALEREGAPSYIHGMKIVRARRSCGLAERTTPQLLALQEKLYEQYSLA